MWMYPHDSRYRETVKADDYISTVPMNTFEDLACYKAAREFRRMISRFCKTMPRTEEYRLKDQLFQASRAVTSYIAEGYGRADFEANLDCCLRARGHLSETLDHLSVASDEGYVTEETFAAMCGKLEDTWKILNGHIVFLEECVRDGMSSSSGALDRKRPAT